MKNTLVIDIETIPPYALETKEVQLRYTRELIQQDLLLKRGNRRADTFEAMKKEIYLDDDLVYKEWRKLSLNVSFCDVIYIGLKLDDEPSFYLANDPVESLLKKLVDIHQSRDVTFVGHNICNFDLPAIFMDLIRKRLYIPPNLFPYPPYPRYHSFNSKIYDISHTFAGMFTSLNHICSTFGIENNDDIDGSQILGLYQGDGLEAITDYCLRDVEREYQVYKFLNLDFNTGV